MIVKIREKTCVYKFCIKCKKNLDTSLFNTNSRMKEGLDSACWDCRKEDAKKYYWNNADRQRKISREYSQKHKDKTLNRKMNNPENYLCMLAKNRSKKEGIYFNLKPEDIHIPEFCPVLGIKLEFSNGKHATDCSPTLDKFIPELGYIKENVVVISKRANRLKGDAYTVEIEALASWMNKRVEDILTNELQNIS